LVSEPAGTSRAEDRSLGAAGTNEGTVKKGGSYRLLPRQDPPSSIRVSRRGFPCSVLTPAVPCLVSSHRLLIGLFNMVVVVDYNAEFGIGHVGPVVLVKARGILQPVLAHI